MMVIYEQIAHYETQKYAPGGTNGTSHSPRAWLHAHFHDKCYQISAKRQAVTQNGHYKAANDMRVLHESQ